MIAALAVALLVGQAVEPRRPLVPVVPIETLDAAPPAPKAAPPAEPAVEEEEEDVEVECAAEEDLQTLAEKVDALQAQLNAVQTKQTWMQKLAVHFTGYLDFGFFWVQGDGSGVRTDTRHLAAPELQGQILGSWVLVGDPLATTINSRGDVASIGDARAVRYDPVRAGGKPSFLVNALNVGLQAGVRDSLMLIASLDFMPRDLEITNAASVGSMFDLKLAFVRYDVPLGDVASIAIEAGKVDSLLGIEYRTQDAPDRLAVTPSVVCRYTCGRPVGLRALGRFFERRFEFSLALTNGTHQVDTFPFHNGVDFNRWKTIATRIGYRFPVFKTFELNVSGALGPQDRQTDDGVLQWHLGGAALVEVGDFTVTSEYVQGAAQGKDDVSGPFVRACGVASCLQYRAVYGQVAWRATSNFVPYARADFRSARHRSGDDFAYISDTWRATLGLRTEIGSNVIIKVEYTFNQELGPVTFPDDVFTSSLVVRY